MRADLVDDVQLLDTVLVCSLRLLVLWEPCSACIWLVGGTIRGTSLVARVSPSGVVLWLDLFLVYDGLLLILSLI